MKVKELPVPKKKPASKTETETISLVKDTIDREDLRALAAWLQEGHRLTKGEVTVQFEKKWSQWLGVQRSVFVNSGSSANLLMFYAAILSKKLKNKKVIAPAVSWVTTVSPILQLELEPILCDCNLKDLGLDIDHLKRLIKKHRPAALILVHVLGHPNQMNQIVELCKENDIVLLEDCCEATGTEYNGRRVGAFGQMSSFSFYFGHHMSTIEGGMVCINDPIFSDYVLSVRSHGWARDISAETKEKWEREFGIDDFRSLYTFYYPGFNFRPTDLQAFLGLRQLSKLGSIVRARARNFKKYELQMAGVDIWKQSSDATLLSNFAYGLAHKNRKGIVKNLLKEGIECRPLICGSIARQPFWIRQFGREHDLPNADFVHDYGFYVPNHPELAEEEIAKVCHLIKSSLAF